MQRFAYSPYIFFFVLVAILISCGDTDTHQKGNRTNLTQINKDVDKVKRTTVPLDTFQNALAQLISGMDCSYFIEKGNIDSVFWNDYSTRVNKAFSKMKKSRLDSMREWMESVSLDKINDTSLLFYPFSGADFLHSYYLYPEANDYLLLAREKIGNIPEINSSKSIDLKKFLNAVDNSLGDIYKRSYFITKRMQTDTRKGAELNGLLPLFYWFIARTDHEIINVSGVYIDSTSALTEKKTNANAPEHLIEGVKFIFRKKGSEKLKSIIYFHCDISNDGFNKNPEFKRYLNSIRNCNSFIKSASYLLHYSTFSDIRDLTLQKSNSILEDDTGIPFKYFDHVDWNVNLFGLYVLPVKDFRENLYQKDLKDAYADTDLYKGELPFSLGYHWGSKAQNQMLYIKK